jgi:hypothetical protein
MRLLIYFLTFVIGSIAAGSFTPKTDLPCEERSSGSAHLFAENLWSSESHNTDLGGSVAGIAAGISNG